MVNRVEMRLQDSKKRRDNFKEVGLGYSKEEAMLEASRCLDCKNPKCVASCPVNINIPAFIKKITEDDIDGAYNTINLDNILPSICGRVCPQENQCEGSCILGIKFKPVAIGNLERYVGDYALSNLTVAPVKLDNGIKVAIVGSGPAGLACAATLRKSGFDVTIYEALHEFGGVLTYGIPEFRLPKDIVKKEIDNIRKLGVKFERNYIIGKSLFLDEMINELNYKAIFIGSGAGLPRQLGIDGENLSGVFYANEFLTRVNLMKAYKFPDNPTPVRIGQNVAVVGGGNVAMDSARTAKRLGAKNVYIVYRRSIDELPARAEEVEHAIEEGIIFKLLNNPVELKSEKNLVKQMKIEKMVLGEPDDSGRRSPLPTGKFELIDVDSVVIAIGQLPNPIIRESDSTLDVKQNGCIIVDSKLMTSKENIYAGGDAVSGAATVIKAMGSGKEAAENIIKKLLKS